MISPSVSKVNPSHLACPILLTSLPFAAVLWWKALLLLDTADGSNTCVRLGVLNQERPRRSLHDLCGQRLSSAVTRLVAAISALKTSFIVSLVFLHVRRQRKSTL
jgi:hypothetical protein